MSFMRKRRIDKDMIEFFDSVNLQDKHRHFIDGCLKSQKKYPQLSVKQWQTVVYLLNVYLAKVLNNDTDVTEEKVKVETQTTITTKYKQAKKERTTAMREDYRK